MTPEQVANGCGIPDHLDNVNVVWPAVVAALDKYKVRTHATEVAAAATIETETGIFYPIEEYGGQAYWQQELGSQWFFHGRGLIQLTWLENYRYYSNAIGIDLINHPEKALDITVSAEVLALYFRDRQVNNFADSANWVRVREAVNGGTNGWSTFISCVNNLLPIADKPIVYTITLVKDASLKLAPNHSCGAKADLAKGCIIKFTGKVTTKWAEVTVLTGTTQKLKPAKGLEGWILRGDLQETHTSG